MNVCEIAVRKFVPTLGVRGISFIHAQMPLCVLTEAMLPNKVILELGRRSVFRPRAFSVTHDSSIVDELRGVPQSGGV